MNFGLVRAITKRPVVRHVVPAMTHLFARYERNTGYPPIQILREAYTEEQLKANVEFRGNSMQLILFYLWMIRFNKVAKRLTKIFQNMCQRLKIYRVPEYNTIAVWMYILTGYVGLERYEYAKRLVKSCHNRDMLVTMVYAIERLGNLVGNNFYHHYFYKGFFNEELYNQVSGSYERSLGFTKKLYAFIKKRYVNRGNVAERTRELNAKEELFATLPRMSMDDLRGFLNSYMLEVPPKEAPPRRKLVKKTKPPPKIVPPQRSSTFIRNSCYIGFDYLSAIPKFRNLWTEGQYDDMPLDINKIEDEEYRLTGGYESPPSDYSTDEKLAIYNIKKMAHLRHDVIYRKTFTKYEPKIELRSAFRRNIRGKKLYHSRLFIKKTKKIRRKLLAPKPVVPRYTPYTRIERLVIERKRMPPFKVLGQPRYPCVLPPPVKKLKIKKNLSTILREAAVLLKEEKKQRERYLELVKGGPSHYNHHLWMEKKRWEDEKRHKQKLVEARLKAQVAYHAAIVEKNRVVKNCRYKRKQFDKERKIHLDDFKRNLRREQRKKTRLRKKVLRARRRLVEKQNLICRKKNLQASALAWESYTLSCSFYHELRKEYKLKKKAVKNQRLVEKVARIQKRELEPIKHIELEERKKLEKEWKLVEHAIKKEKIKRTRDYNFGIKQFASTYVIVKRRKKLLRKYGATGKRVSMMHDRILRDTPHHYPARKVIEYGNSIMDSFERQLEEFNDMKTLLSMRNKVTSIRTVTSGLKKCLVRLTGIKMQKHMTALEKADVNVAFIIELEKVKKSCEWYPPLRRTSSTRLSRGSFSKMSYHYSYGEGYEYESSNYWQLMEMEQRRQMEKQAMLEEQVLYLCDVIKAIEIYFRDFVTPPSKKRTPRTDIESNIRRLRQRLKRIKSEIFHTRQRLKYKMRPRFSDRIRSRYTYSLHSFGYYVRNRFRNIPVLVRALKKIKFTKLRDLGRKVLRPRKLSDTSLSQDEESEISLASNQLLAEIKELSKRKRMYLRRRQRKLASTVTVGNVQLTTEEEDFLKAQPPGYNLYINQWGNPVYELKVKNEFKYIWEWVPITIPKPAEKPKYPKLSKAPYSLDKESVDSNDSAVLLSTKEHNAKYCPIDSIDTPFNENKWRKNQLEFSHLPKEVRKRYLNSVQRYVWEYYRNHPKGGRPEKVLVHIPLGDIEVEYLYIINKRKTKTSRRLKEKLHEIEKQLRIYARKHKSGHRRRRM